MDTENFIEELSRGFRSFRTPTEQGASAAELVFFIVLLILAVVVVMLYLRIKGLQSDSGNVVKHRKMLIDSIKKHLSGFQIKILEDISDMLQLENPEKLFHDTFFFEHSIDRFLKFRIEKGDIKERCS